MEDIITFSPEAITIEDMLQNIFTTYKVEKRKRDIVAHYLSKCNITLFDDGAKETAIREKVEAVLNDDKSSPQPYLKYNKGKYSKARQVGTNINPALPIDTNYIGKAGECSVMAELLFRGYNVNNMMVDEGIDLVASKNNVFYYIQVKTKTIVEKNKFYFQIKQDRFDSFVGTQIRYILVARCSLNKEDRIIYFIFTNNDIQRLMYNKVIPEPTNDSNILSLKIEYDTRTGKSYMYDNKYKDDVSFNMNNFNL
ncbi:MAG: group I intron-associated PD-(D/E)XK endonuclease [Alloprevotella sp.]